MKGMRERNTFTLIGLLVVIAIIAILAAGLENATCFCVMTAWR